ncbi:uncharacterized protein LOC101854131 [Aplysia californica]|uniref:Uncharacterized protein LOC101854131 n=1 Tax=Aplysia californica TaxID=6500 RepID=A0ABM0K9G2_APLCA|nr:uncharacterized protein LOC101854131 [Aplysia californica]
MTMARPAYERFRNVLELLVKDEKILLNDQPRYVTFRYGGLEHALFDRNGHPSLFQLMKTAVIVRSIGLFCSCEGEISSMIDFSDLLNQTGSTIFVAVTDFEMSRDMYNRFLVKAPLDARVSLGHVGNGSITMQIELFLPGNPQAIMTHKKKVVLVNPDTRKPMPLPEWYKQKFAGKGVLEGIPFRIEKFQRPAKTFFRRSEITWSDTDSNNHTNYASYSRLATDAIHTCLFLKTKAEKERMRAMDQSDQHLSLSVNQTSEVSDSRSRDHTPSGQQTTNVSDQRTNPTRSECKSMAVSGDHARDSAESGQQNVAAVSSVVPESVQLWGGDISALGCLSEKDVVRGLKRVEVSYLQECGEGDVVETHVWQEPGVRGRLKCSVEGMGGGEVLCQITLEYHEPLSGL